MSILKGGSSNAGAGWRQLQLAPLRFALSLFLWTVGGLSASAHDPGLSSVLWRWDQDRFVAELTLAQADLQTLLPSPASSTSSQTAQTPPPPQIDLEQLGMDAFEGRLDGQLIVPSVTFTWNHQSQSVHFHLSYPQSPQSEIVMASALIHRLPPGHRQYCLVTDVTGRRLGEQILDRNHPVFAVRLPESAAPPSSPGATGHFLWLGVEHILTGYDHLVFLFGLLIVGVKLKPVLKIITSFTLAHSLTLALVTLGWIRCPASISEPLIAVSIVYVGLENLLRRDLDRRWLLTFAFGLIHGCGFAFLLRDLGVGSDGAGIFGPLLFFNLGVELGQLAVAALVLPCVWMLHRVRGFERFWVPACSLLIIVAGTCWLVGRL